jgi:selenocysteine lyase/cysteine desulfurase
MPVDVKKLNIDFLATSGYKWLLSPMATGFLYVRRELTEEVDLSIVGYRSDENPHDFSFRDFKPCESARRFEHGQLNFPGFAGMREAILLLEEVDVRAVRERILNLTDRIVEGVQKMSAVKIKPTLIRENRSGILSLVCKDAEEVAEKLRRQGIIVSVRRGGIRVSPHFYNTEEEIEEFLVSLSRLVEV